jgi:hypothetical protein
METDHDKHQRDVFICLEELQRFNDRVISYGKVAEKNRDNYESNFNVQKYVFELSRHFYHNINHIETKIKHMKQTLCEVKDIETQT